MQTVRWISGAMGRKKWMIGILSLLQSVLALSGIAFALLMRRAIDSAVAGKSAGFWQAGILLMLLILGQIILRALNRFLEEDTRAALDNCFRQKVFGGILKNDYQRMTSYHTGELMNRITSDSNIITDGTVSLIPSLVSMCIRILGVLIVMYAIEPWFTLVFLAAGCLMAGLSLLPRKWLKRLHKQVQEEDGNVRSFVQECLESLLVIRTFGCEDKMQKQSQEKMMRHRRIRRKRSNVSNLFSIGLSLAMQCGYLFGFIWCGTGILKGTMTYGTLTAVIQLIGQIQSPFVGLGGAFPKFASMMASAERLMELTEKSEGESGTVVGESGAAVSESDMGETELGIWKEAELGTVMPESAIGEAGRRDKKPLHMSRDELYRKMKEIRFDQVSFQYAADRQVLKDDTFHIYKGEFTALVGTSGIGKSTIMKLLLSVYEPDSGTITLELSDGSIPVSQVPGGMFAYVPQGNHLMSGTICEVVGFAEQSGEVDREQVIRACKAACAHEFIAKLPEGYDTLLGEKGAGLSEGQMQRLAVARAVYSRCPILLLDEATSALDADTERSLIGSLRELEDRTVLIVTHRKDVVELCDRVLERGK